MIYKRLSIATRIIVLGLVFILTILLIGCINSESENETILPVKNANENPYNAVMYGNPYEVRKWVNDDFYEENLTFGAWSNILEEYVIDEKYPRVKNLIIRNQDDFNITFKKFPLEMDFEKEMILMHGITTASGSELVLSEILLNNQTLYIKYGFAVSEEPTAPNASMPLTKWTVVKLEKLDISAFIFDL